MGRVLKKRNLLKKEIDQVQNLTMENLKKKEKDLTPNLIEDAK